jgi:hypothetical protein
MMSNFSFKFIDHTKLQLKLFISFQNYWHFTKAAVHSLLH